MLFIIISTNVENWMRVWIAILWNLFEKLKNDLISCFLIFFYNLYFNDNTEKLIYILIVTSEKVHVP